MGVLDNIKVSFQKVRQDYNNTKLRLDDHEKRILALEFLTPAKKANGNKKKRKKRWGFYTQGVMRNHEKRIKNNEREIKLIWQKLKELEKRKK